MKRAQESLATRRCQTVARFPGPRPSPGPPPSRAVVGSRALCRGRPGGSLQTGLRRKPPRFHGLDQCFVVLLVSRVRALAMSRPTAFFSLLPRRFSPTSALIQAVTSSIFRWAYQTSRVLIFAASRILSRYLRTPALTIARRSDGAKPRSRPAISKLAASLFTSHSHGPGRVSSKSLMSNTSWRSGEPNNPKLDRWASPQLNGDPRPRCRREVGSHDQRSTPVEGARRDEHPPIPDRDKLRDPAFGLLLQQRHRFGSGRGWFPGPMARPVRPSARILTPGGPLLRSEVSMPHAGVRRRPAGPAPPAPSEPATFLESSTPLSLLIAIPSTDCGGNCEDKNLTEPRDSDICSGGCGRTSRQSIHIKRAAHQPPRTVVFSWLAQRPDGGTTPGAVEHPDWTPTGPLALSHLDRSAIVHDGAAIGRPG
jgi:hypothetical protein